VPERASDRRAGQPSPVADGWGHAVRLLAPVRSTERPAGGVIPATGRELAVGILAGPRPRPHGDDAEAPRHRARGHRRVVGYCAKLGGRRRDDDVDLFTVLPTAS
jgi:hypothetical protein